MKNSIRKFGSGFIPLMPPVWEDDLMSFFNEPFPAVNFSESGKDYKLEVSVPGYEKRDISLKVEKNVISISAHKESKEEKSDEKILRREFQTSSFQKSFTLPDNVNTNKIAASQKDGVLTIILPKQEKAVEDAVKKIEIK